MIALGFRSLASRKAHRTVAQLGLFTILEALHSKSRNLLWQTWASTSIHLACCHLANDDFASCWFRYGRWLVCGPKVQRRNVYLHMPPSCSYNSKFQAQIVACKVGSEAQCSDAAQAVLVAACCFKGNTQISSNIIQGPGASAAMLFFSIFTSVRR